MKEPAMAPTCINLRERFGQQYRIGFDEAAENKNDPWMVTMPCRVGTIYPHSAEMLALDLDGHPKIAKQVAKIPGIFLHQDGDNEKTLLFPVGLFDEVAALVEPKKVRRLSDEQRERLIQAGLRFRFGDGAGASSGGLQAPRIIPGDQEVA